MDWKFSFAMILLIMSLKKAATPPSFFIERMLNVTHRASRPDHKLSVRWPWLTFSFAVTLKHTHHNQKAPPNKNKHTIPKITFYSDHISTHLILFTTVFNRIFGSVPYSLNNIYTNLLRTSKLIFPIVYQLLYSNRNFNSDRLFSGNNLRVHCFFNIFLYLCWVQKNDYVVNSSHPRPSSSLPAEVSYWVCLYLKRHYDTTWGLPAKASLFYFPVVEQSPPLGSTQSG